MSILVKINITLVNSVKYPRLYHNSELRLVSRSLGLTLDILTFFHNFLYDVVENVIFSSVFIDSMQKTLKSTHKMHV